MKVRNMRSVKGNDVPNQFIVEGAALLDPEPIQGLPNITLIGTMFQSYTSNIVFKTEHRVYLDSIYWDYSTTTGKYRNQFLGESIAETRAKIKSGEYKLANLN